MRIEIENGLYHVTCRGWERKTIVKDDQDRQYWLRLLDRVTVRRNWRLFAWALMNNPFHLLLRTPQANLSVGMHDRVGALIQGRFKAILVQEVSHAWELTRDLHLHPVRAGLVDDLVFFSFHGD